MTIHTGMKSFFLGAFSLCLLSISNISYGYFIDHAKEFDFSNLTSGHELGCLALNIYHEGRGENTKGQSAIAAVTMNRVQSKHFPDTVCEVVWQRKQFSWTNIASRHHSVIDQSAWKKALMIAKLFLDGAQMADVGQATHYHASYVRPYWIASKQLIGKVGNHYFYIVKSA